MMGEIFLEGRNSSRRRARSKSPVPSRSPWAGTQLYTQGPFLQPDQPATAAAAGHLQAGLHLQLREYSSSIDPKDIARQVRLY